mmetsp:Transcript_16633/g.25125  ORF Transcript_16633/g.25125 Transcript_16633/m.25125 type:complete len:472 (-) Transcript_16633:222-1637(-)|eukprot:CAMPEP_0178906316 /NCGR_PEP_ID=MMETSP0786-20121207/6754_1 /TAXON_ID=186022 /ORGANISM="Thalassionema frauenfeldii, Strain CCMP 1798" /LENGTH=471 /DNA_ID=CAMNT_0020578003 /DNA_START=157 /DNA_END=1572 /DNA_ORIENTATION=+
MVFGSLKNLLDKDQSEPVDERIDSVVVGMKCASLAITDDKEGTLASVARLNPWHEEALKIITGSKEEAHKPLTYLLKEYMELETDCIIDESGVTKGGHFLDTQGYIAHNDEMIVLAFRCTTSVFDWLTNLNSTSSEWEVEEDVAHGFSGYCSSMEGLCCNGGEEKPRVHTGFYNNFLACVPLIQEHIAPLLAPDQPRRTLHVVGHSLGAGIATLAACYFLLEYDWSVLPHSLISVTAGSPRAVLKQMQEMVEERLEAMSSEKVQFLRVVRHKDVVATVPPAVLGFKHLGTLVHIAQDGTITFDSDMPDRDTDEDRVKIAAQRQLECENSRVKDRSVEADNSESDEDENDADDEGSSASYHRKISKIPKAFRDHMPDFYLNPMKNIKPVCFPVEIEDKQQNQSLFSNKEAAADTPAEEKKKFKFPFSLGRKNKVSNTSSDKAEDAKISSTKKRWWLKKDKAPETEPNAAVEV